VSADVCSAGMRSWVALVTSRPGIVVTNVALAALWGQFAVRHLREILASGAGPLLLFVLSESVVALLFVVRKRPVEVSDDLLTWAIGIAGTFVPFLYEPAPRADDAIAVAGAVTMLTGVCLQLLGTLSLNRSFGIVPALREVKTTGLYRMVRHPIYSSYLFVWTGYVTFNPGAWNLVVYGLAVALTVERVRREEALLLTTAPYRDYVRRVPYRLLPYLW